LSFIATRELVGAASWSTAVFTTYALSLSFFEAVVLDQLVRRRSATPMVFADVAGVRSALSEYGARRVGRDYDLEPVALRDGVFHAKVAVLAEDGDADAHLVVGSGNLTFGGWAGNLECVEHLHPSFAADAFADAEDFFLALALEDRIQHEAFNSLERLGARLGRAARSGSANGRIRFLHSLSGALLRQIADHAFELGGAQRLVAAAPFWDDGGRALANLCAALDLDHAHVHAHHPFGVVQAGVADNWPRNPSLDVRAVRVAAIFEAAEQRPLHAKMFEVLCRRGRLLVSGSANGSRQALGQTGNVEAVVLRIWRQPQVGWKLDPSDPLPPRETGSETEPEAVETSSVLRAELDRERLKGRVFGPFPSGPASAFQVSVDGPQLLAETAVDANGAFELEAASLEVEAWRSGRLILRLMSGTAVAEGFVAFRDLQEVRRRAGPAMSSLLAVMGHLDAPEDALALMSWFQEHPEALTATDAEASGGSASSHDEAEAEAYTDPAALLRVGPNNSPGWTHTGGAAPAWKRFLTRLMGALAEPRPAFGASGEDDPDLGAGETVEAAARRAKRRAQDAERRGRQSAKALRVFDTVFDRMLERATSGTDHSGLLALTQYVCQRLAPDPALGRSYLNRLIDAFVAAGAPDALPAAAGAVMAGAAIEPDLAPAARRARGRLRKLGWDLHGPQPDTGPAAGFLRPFDAPADPEAIWRAIQATRTPAEEIRAYRQALEAGAPRPHLDWLASLAEWPLLAAAYDADPRRREVRFVEVDALRCRCNYTALPSAARLRLHSARIVRAPCGHVLLCEAD